MASIFSCGNFAPSFIRRSGVAQRSQNPLIFCRYLTGAKPVSEVKSSSCSKSVLERNEQKATIEAAVMEAKGPNVSHQNAMQDMPFVSTKAYGPNGTKVDGFLYRYKKGEDVRIVCVCHGMFLSPAEFVKHGGGGDVEHPLKHIVVNPSPHL